VLLLSLLSTCSSPLLSPFLSPAAPHPHLPSFPTRRSSDLRFRLRAIRRRRIIDPVSRIAPSVGCRAADARTRAGHLRAEPAGAADRKSTRLNSSHGSISYAVFCLKKKNTYKYDSRYVNSRM